MVGRELAKHVSDPSLTAVFSSDALGGSELFNLEFLRTAHRRGVRIDAVVPGEGSLCEALAPFVKNIDTVPIPVDLTSMSRFESRIDTIELPRRLRALAAYLPSLRRVLGRHTGPVCSLGFRSQLAVAAVIPLSRPGIWVVHEVVPTGPSAKMWRLAARRASRIVTYSHAAASQSSLRDRDAEVLAVRFDLSRYAGLKEVEEVRTIGLVGDLVELKNHLLAVELSKCLRDCGEKVSVLLVGRDVSRNVPRTKDYVERVRRAVAENPDTELIASAPDAMPSVMARIDLLLHVSTVPESFGRVCVEAMAAGRPVVAYDHGGVSELVDDGRTGFLCPPGDSDSVAQAILKFLRNQRLGAAMGRAARKDVLARFGEDPDRRDTIGDALADFATGHR
jgi:glycosyltransferase involved in cell wall biosynthesis